MILVGLGGQVGRQKGVKIDAKRHRKNDGKKEGGGATLGGLGFIPSLIGGILEMPSLQAFLWGCRELRCENRSKNLRLVESIFGRKLMISSEKCK